MLNEKLRRLLFEKNISKTALAKHLGVSLSAVCMWTTLSKHARNPNIDNLRKTARYCGVSLNYFDEEPTENEKTAAGV